MWRMTRLLTLLWTLLIAASAPATAQITLTTDTVVRAEVLPGWRTSDGTHQAAIALRLAKGWKTYWRVPGAAGIPPSFDWGGSRNLAAVQVHWPVPVVTTSYGLRSIGYFEQVILPIRVRPRDPGAPVRLRAQLDIGVCEDICIPVTLTLDQMLPVGGATDPVILAALRDQPMTARTAGVRRALCQITPTADGLMLDVTLQMPRLGRREAIAIELPDKRIHITDGATQRSGETLRTQVELLSPRGGAFPLFRDQVRITVIGDRQAAEIQGCTGA